MQNKTVIKTQFNLWILLTALQANKLPSFKHKSKHLQHLPQVLRHYKQLLHLLDSLFAY
jgi:hypothetical protein